MSTRYLLFFRTILLGTLLLESLYAPGAQKALGWMLTAFPLYGACSLVLYGLERSGRLPQAVIPWTFCLDLGMAASSALVMPGGSSDFFVAFFLVILSSTLMRKPGLSFLIAGTACLVYGGMTVPEADMAGDPGRLMKLALLAVMAFFSTFMTGYARQIEAQTAEPYERRIAWMERLSMVGRALSGVLHEVKTPLGTVIISAENARHLLARGEDAAEELAIITQEAGRASEILAHFLEFTKPADLALSRLRMAAPLEKVAGAMKTRLQERSISLDLRLSGESFVLASERHLVQVFTNLFINAVQAMPSGGTLTVRQTQEAGRVRVAVADTGSGIAAKDIDLLCEPYLTTRGEAGGCGLGLSIARWIVHKHHGELRIESPGPGKGASVTVDLPAA